MSEVVKLTQDLVSIESVSRQSNGPVSDYVENWLRSAGFDLERLEYTSETGELKVSLIAKKGEGSGGLAFCSHTDTVPGQEEDWPAFDPVVKDGRLYGRGSCDMKGPLAATMLAARDADPAKLKQPIYVVATADEEIGLLGARDVVDNSQILSESKPQLGVIAEPTRLIPVYAHKGYARTYIAAYGEAAHTSTGKGTSATFLIAPFMAEMAELSKLVSTDPAYMNDEFVPPVNGMNMVVNDGNCALNVTAPKTEVTIGFRVMPNSRAPELQDMIIKAAEKYGLEVSSAFADALYVSRESELLHAACAATNEGTPETVPYGTDGIYLQEAINELVILGPGDIAVAHTVGESIPVEELERSVGVYQRMIEQLCM